MNAGILLAFLPVSVAGQITAGINGTNMLGYQVGVCGTASPANPKFRGAEIYIIGDHDLSTTFSVSMNGNALAQNFFSVISFPSLGKTLKTSDATLSHGSSDTTWLWSGKVGFINTSSYAYAVF